MEASLEWSTGRIVFLVLAALYTCATCQDTQQLWGSGGDVGYGLTWQVTNMMSSRSRPQAYIAYRWIGTSIGIQEFMGAASDNYTRPYNHFMISDQPLPADKYAALQPTGGVLQVPLAVTKVALYHGVVNLTAPLYLDPCTIAGILNGTITMWDDPAIRAANPSPAVQALLGPVKIQQVFLDNWDNAFTYSLTAYLAEKCPYWTRGAVYDLGPEWRANAVVVTEFNQLVTAMHAGGGITWIDAHGGAWGALKEVTLLNRYDVKLTSSSANDTQVSTALQLDNVTNIDGDWSRRTFMNTPAPNSWPLTLLNYLIMRKDSTFLGKSGPLLSALATFYLSDEVDTLLNQRKLIPLQQAVRRNLSDQVKALLKVDSSVTWRFENSSHPIAVEGQGEYWFSGRRNTWLTAESNRLDNRVEVQQNSLNNLTAIIAAQAAQISSLQSLLNQVFQNESNAADVRAKLLAITQENRDNSQRIEKATQMATAGVVIAVLLAVVAIILAAVYVAKTKKLDAKYSKYLPLGVKARFAEGPEEL
mmetsp:Transcript_12610/g.27248  ORF Transcript_12610/g.27248 Transcript_12610/m.27248 type:complete len:531 (+) Transcript_12610:87-1679(+)|eukprot:CAMPEP_0202891974 /NCGR_PEP_ID=MMETSP1392-20130828/1864_1 /ASSEMBLY_ACC=CAM_ASM_000868 /TAXON_ID=225041 /ORGANISM="Chlamydomonas chlamydogama, Strain SAG 11-48b" /LENGTH=530 /DNA_ID=CAMNT_0049575849 /DNA_START=35 /DNA_END=1627 /DNA_ORIENTATION=-